MIVPMVILEIAILYKLFMTKDRFILEPPISHFEKQVWIVYKASYSNNATDGNYNGWRDLKEGRSNIYVNPPFEIASRVFPQLGLYSSHDKVLIKTHMRMIARHGIDGIIIPWVPTHIDNGFVDKSVKIILKQAKKIGISVAIRIEKYQGADNEALQRDVEYIRSNYAYDPIYLKFDRKPIIFFNVMNDIHSLQEYLISMRNKLFFITSLEKNPQIGYALESGFNGYNTYGPSENSTWLARPIIWKKLYEDAVQRGMLFIPTICPGYDLFYQTYTQWFQRFRKSGEYYRKSFEAATNSDARIVLIESFNDFTAGSAIEPIVERPDYPTDENSWGGPSNFYMDLTKTLIQSFKAKNI